MSEISLCSANDTDPYTGVDLTSGYKSNHRLLQANQISRRSSTIRLHVRWSTIAELPVVGIFLWYVLYPGLRQILPGYEQIDDLLLLMMLLVSITLTIGRGKLRMPHGLAIALLVINGVILASSLAHPSTWNDTPEFIYRANRAFIVLLYAFTCDLRIERLLRKIVWWCRFLVLLNLPVLLYNLGRYNITILLPANNDAVRGFFPFQNNDSITVLLVILVVCDAYTVIFQKRLRQIYFLAPEYVLLVATMNFKSILVVTFGLAIVVILRSRRPILYGGLLAAIVVIPLSFVYSTIYARFERINTSPVYIAAFTILEGNVSEYSWLVGTGPGSFTSPMAFESNSYLAGKYGLLALRNYWRDVYTGVTGTLSTWTSSALMMFGEIGMVGTLAFVFTLLWLTWQCLQQARYSAACLLGFVMGLYVIPVGVFLDSWSWGYEVTMLMLGVKAAYDIRRNHLLARGSRG